MAILRNLEVTVSVGGKSCVEHDTNIDVGKSESMVTKYIEVISGQCFVVNCAINAGFPNKHKNIVFEIFVDGTWLESSILHKTKMNSFSFEGVISTSGGKWTLEAFKFTDILTTEDQGDRTVEEMTAMVAELGTITVKARRIHAKGLEKRHQHSKNVEVQSLQSQVPIPETALKTSTTSLRATLAEPEPTSKCYRFSDIRYIDTADKPYATFAFKYRSTKALQDLLIIPRPLPLSERSVDGLSREELMELVVELRQTQTNTKVKSEPVIGLKRERTPDNSEILSSARVAKVAKTQKRVMIDLD
ncbi:hypothetical protein MMC13_006064 [Lambiella insularis]|nr:hypothetical protein [Lambiella insularis]